MKVHCQVDTKSAGETSRWSWLSLGKAGVAEPRLATLADFAVFCRRFEASADSGALFPFLGGSVFVT
jgi:hypothetical protein